jgi:hypothetical protein
MHFSSRSITSAALLSGFNLLGCRKTYVDQAYLQAFVTELQMRMPTAARNLAHGLGIPVHILDGRIYQQGPGVAFLPSSGARSTVANAPSLEEEEADEAEMNDHKPVVTTGFHGAAPGGFGHVPECERV